LTSIASIDDAGRLADTIAAHLPLKLENKQAVLALSRVKARLENLFEQIEREVDILNVDKKSVVASSAKWRKTNAIST